MTNKLQSQWHWPLPHSLHQNLRKKRSVFQSLHCKVLALCYHFHSHFHPPHHCCCRVHCEFLHPLCRSIRCVVEIYVGHVHSSFSFSSPIFTHFSKEHRVSVPAGGLRRNDPASSTNPKFSHQIHTFYYLKPQNWDVSFLPQTAGATYWLRLIPNTLFCNWWKHHYMWC